MRISLFSSSLSLEGDPLGVSFPPRTANGCIFGVVVHVRGGEGLSPKVSYPITELVVTRHDKAYIFSVKGMVDLKCRATSIRKVRQVGGLNAVA